RDRVRRRAGAKDRAPLREVLELEHVGGAAAKLKDVRRVERRGLKERELAAKEEPRTDDGPAHERAVDVGLSDRAGVGGDALAALRDALEHEGAARRRAGRDGVDARGAAREREPLERRAVREEYVARRAQRIDLARDRIAGRV